MHYCSEHTLLVILSYVICHLLIALKLIYQAITYNQSTEVLTLGC